MHNKLPTGLGFAVLAAVLFGASAPFAKLLLGEIPPILLAGLLYLGSGSGLTLVYLSRKARATEARLTVKDAPWLAGAVFFGGVVGPVLLMVGLRATSPNGFVMSLLIDVKICERIRLNCQAISNRLSSTILVGW
jgi:drug/metabolite transporter (DMT)-like permease